MPRLRYTKVTGLDGFTWYYNPVAKDWMRPYGANAWRINKVDPTKTMPWYPKSRKIRHG